LKGIAVSITHPFSKRPALESQIVFQSPIHWRSFAI
jgi:hypothetical protein